MSLQTEVYGDLDSLEYLDSQGVWIVCRILQSEKVIGGGGGAFEK